MIDRCRCLGRSRTWRSQRGRGRCQGSPYSDLQRHSNHLLVFSPNWMFTGFLYICVPLCSVETSSSTPAFLEEGSTVTAGGERRALTLTHRDRQVQYSPVQIYYSSAHVYYSSVQRQVCYLFLHLQTGVLLTCTDVHVKRGVLLTCTGEYRCVTHLYMQPCRSPHCCSCSYFLCSLRK